MHETAFTNTLCLSAILIGEEDVVIVVPLLRALGY